MVILGLPITTVDLGVFFFQSLSLLSANLVSVYSFNNLMSGMVVMCHLFPVDFLSSTLGQSQLVCTWLGAVYLDTTRTLLFFVCEPFSAVRREPIGKYSCTTEVPSTHHHPCSA